MYMTKYEDLIKQAKNKDASVDTIAKRYKMSVLDVKIIQEWKEKYEEAQAKCDQLQRQIDRFFKENNDLYNRIADLTESLKSKDYFESPDYQYLIEENRKLEEERNELLTDNKKLAAQVEDKINQLRKTGMI